MEETPLDLYRRDRMRTPLIVLCLGLCLVFVIVWIDKTGDQQADGAEQGSEHFRGRIAQLTNRDPQAVGPTEYWLNHQLGRSLERESEKASEEVYQAFAGALAVAEKQTAIAYYHMGSVRMRQELFEEALNYFALAIEKNPDFYDAYQNRAVTLRWMGRYEESVQASKDTIERFPRFAKAYASMGWAHEYLEQHEDAIEAHLEAIRIEPAWDFPKSRLAGCFQNLDDIEARARLLDEVSEVDPQLASQLRGTTAALREN